MHASPPQHHTAHDFHRPPARPPARQRPRPLALTRACTPSSACPICAPQGLVDDIGALRPTIFAGVPRVFDRIYAGVMAKVRLGVAGCRSC